MKKTTFKGIFILLFFIVLLLILYLSSSIVKPIFFSLILSYLLNPLVKLMISKGIDKRWAVLISIFALLFAAFLTMFYLIPGIIRDVLGIIGNINTYDSEIMEFINKIGYNSLPVYLKNVVNDNISKLQLVLIDYLNRFFKQIIDFSMELPTYVLAPVFIYYFLADKDYFLNILKKLIPIRMRGKGIELGHQINNIIGSFIMSQIILSVIIAVLTFAALIVLKVKYPLIIAFINGVANIIPYFGPVIGFVPAFFSAATESLNKALIVVVVFLIIQQFESAVIAPKLMSDSIGIHPVFVMIVLLLGGKFFGGWGLILSVPIAGILKVTYDYVIRNLY